jgi:hypothetical protein
MPSRSSTPMPPSARRLPISLAPIAVSSGCLVPSWPEE